MILTVAALLLALGCRQASAITVCGVTATALGFGVYSTQASTPTDSTATVTVNCTVVIGFTAAWTVALSTGGGGVYAGRVLSSGADTLGYQLYADPARSQIWGDGTAGTVMDSGSYSAVAIGTTTATYTAYGRILARQNVAPGLYLDTVLVTITY